ncbi:MAG: hypothetical protein H0T89_26745 [Deltaproteobacteria bacterium]|nr:hypothetical protein [Deltaproteobacteria bacterium]MDQ3298576.1 hypothetical protein [Myxococcota bacterium]
MFDVAYGVPERSVSEAQLRAALAVVAEAFDEAPARMHAVLSPPGQGIRWFSFACTVFARDHVLSQGHFTDVMETELAELLVVVRRPGEDPASCEVHGTRGGQLSLRRDGNTINVSPALPPEAARDGEVDEIALAALGLPNVRPFVALAKPTHEVALRGKNVHAKYPIVPFSGAVLSVRVHPRPGSTGAGEQFAHRPRTVDSTDRRALRVHVERVLAKATEDSYWHPVFEDKVHEYAREVARVGGAVAPVLVELLAQPSPRPQTSQIALTALGLLGVAADAMVPWLGRGSETLRLSAFCALARQAEAARPALLAASTSRKSAERVGAQALLELLDAKDFAPIRDARAARDKLAAKARAEIAASCAKRYGLASAALVAGPARLAWYLRAAIESDESSRLGTAIHQSTYDSMWAVALFLIETPVRPVVCLSNYTARDSLLERAAGRYGAAFGPVADVLLRFPPLADDPILRALAAGKPVPSYRELEAARTRSAAAKKPAAKKPAAKKPAAKKPAAKKPAAKKPAAKKPVKQKR